MGKFRKITLIIAMVVIAAGLSNLVYCIKKQEGKYPQTQISNQHLVMKLYLPDAENGFYRATRFDWSGVIYSLTYQGHEYFEEWKDSHDPLFHEDITGPVESFDGNGTGYEEAAVGEGFLRIGVGILEKENNDPYIWNHTYKILDHGKWTINKGKDWIEFIHEVGTEAGWACRYTKKIVLMSDEPGFLIRHKLENTGQKKIETNQFNHNFFVIDATKTGPDFEVEFSFDITVDEAKAQANELVKVAENKVQLTRQFENNESAWLSLAGFSNKKLDHQFKVINNKTGAGVQLKSNKALCKMVFWANPNTLCPENFVCIDLAPGEAEEWGSEYTFFTKN